MKRQRKVKKKEKKPRVGNRGQEQSKSRLAVKKKLECILGGMKDSGQISVLRTTSGK